MAGARDIARATRLIRKQQAARNAEAMAEAQRRQTLLEEEAGALRPSVRRSTAAIAGGAHEVKRAENPANKMMPPGENKGDVTLVFETEAARAVVERYFEAHPYGTENADRFIEVLREMPHGPEGLTEDDVNEAVDTVDSEKHDAGIYASAAAAELAAEHQLEAVHFDGLTPSGRRGFTLMDVRRVLEEIRAHAGTP